MQAIELKTPLPVLSSPTSPPTTLPEGTEVIITDQYQPGPYHARYRVIRASVILSGISGEQEYLVDEESLDAAKRDC